MAYDAARMKKAYSPILATVFVLVIFTLPCSSFSAQSIYTIQLGSYLSMKGANKHYNLVVKKLNPQDRSSLRIEKVGKYYALRLGVFENSSKEAERLFRRVKAVNPGAIILAANFSKRKIVGMVDSTTIKEVPVLPAETVVTPVAESEAILSLAEAGAGAEAGAEAEAEAGAEAGAERPAEGRETAATILPSVFLKPQSPRAQTPVVVRESQPLIPDGRLIGLAIIIGLFMFEHYILALARLGRFDSLKRRFAESAAVKWLTESKPVELPYKRETLQLGIETGPITPDVYIVGNYSVLADESHAELRDDVVENEAEEIYQATDRNGPAGLPNNVWLAESGEFDLDEGRIGTDEKVLTSAEETTEVKLEVPESRNLHTVVPRTSPRKGQTGGAANKIGRSEKSERENRVARAVLAVSFFGEE